jgi:hypothetical protein
MKYLNIVFLLLTFTISNINLSYAEVNAEQKDIAEKKLTNPKSNKTTVGFLGNRFHKNLPRVFQWKDESSWQPSEDDIYLSLWDFSYSINDTISLQTLSLPWLTALIDVSASGNLGVRSSLWSGDDWSVGSSLSYLRINLSTLAKASSGANEKSEETNSDTPDAAINMLLWDLYASWQISKYFLIGSSLKVNYIGAAGDAANSGTSLNFGTSNAHLRLQVAWAWGTKWSLWYIHNRMLFQSVGAQAYINQSLDDGGQLEVWFEHDQNIPISNAYAHGLRLVRRGSLVIFSFGLDWGKVPFYILGNVGPADFALPYLNLGFIF